MGIDKIDNSKNIVQNQIRDNNMKMKVDEEIKKINIKDKSSVNEYSKKELPISEKIVIEAIEKANKAVSGINTKFEFSIHERTKEIMVKVINSDTNDIVREIPSEKILDMLADMWEMAGILVDKKG